MFHLCSCFQTSSINQATLADRVDTSNGILDLDIIWETATTSLAKNTTSVPTIDDSTMSNTGWTPNKEAEAENVWNLTGATTTAGNGGGNSGGLNSKQRSANDQAFEDVWGQHTFGQTNAGSNSNAGGWHDGQATGGGARSWGSR